jgi:hypothetical protein
VNAFNLPSGVDARPVGVWTTYVQFTAIASVRGSAASGSTLTSQWETNYYVDGLNKSGASGRDQKAGAGGADSPAVPSFCAF